MQTVKATLIILIFAALLSACGNKGPLYLPDENPAVEKESGKDTEAEEDKKKEKTEKKDSVSR
jgi:predicted small lipoprotein YifL